MQNTAVTLNQVSQLLPKLLKANVVPFIHGSPGVGKSAIVKSIADKFNLELIDVRLSQLDPSDMLGLPTFNSNKVKYLPPEIFPIEGDTLPKGKSGWLLFLDEANGASHAVQMACYKLILDRMVGNHKLHDKVKMVAAGNLDTDNAITNTMSSALISRFAHFDVTLNKDEWLKWASNSGIDYRITAFLSFKPTLLYTFNPDATSPYACPRTWQMVSNVINGTTIADEDIALLRSMVGEGVAHEFVTYNKLYTELPSFDDVMRDPKGIKISEHLGTQWALMSMVASNIDDKNASKVISFIERLSMELQICAMREVKGRKGKEWIIANALDWVSKTSKEIYRVE